MGMEFKDLTEEDLCNLMCGKPEDDEEEVNDENEQQELNKRD